MKDTSHLQTVFPSHISVAFRLTHEQLIVSHLRP